MININDIAKYEESDHGYITRTIHVGAIGSKLESLKETLTPHFDSTPTFQKKRTAWNNTIEEYFLQGKIKGVDYQVYAYCMWVPNTNCSGCPTPILMTHIHEASVTLPDGARDSLSPIIEREFQSYRTEVIEKEKIVEESIPKMQEAVARAKVAYQLEQLARTSAQPVGAEIMSRFNPIDE